MSERVSKHIAQYNSLPDNKRAKFNLSDYVELMDISRRRNDGNYDLFMLAYNAERFGYIVGYNRAVNDMKKRSARQPKR